jgi:hypothetical protein
MPRRCGRRGSCRQPGPKCDIGIRQPPFGRIAPRKRRGVDLTLRADEEWRTSLTKLRSRSGLCHRKCSGQVTTGRTGRHGTDFDRRALSGVTCGLYKENRGFAERRDRFFKTTAIDHSAIPPACASLHHRACFGVARQSAEGATAAASKSALNSRDLASLREFTAMCHPKRNARNATGRRCA